MILSFIYIRKVPREMFALGFQHFPRDLANVNEWKIIYDSYNETQFVMKQHLHRSQYYFDMDHNLTARHLIPVLEQPSVTYMYQYKKNHYKVVSFCTCIEKKKKKKKKKKTWFM